MSLFNRLSGYDVKLCSVAIPIALSIDQDNMRFALKSFVDAEHSLNDSGYLQFSLTLEFALKINSPVFLSTYISCVCDEPKMSKGERYFKTDSPYISLFIILCFIRHLRDWSSAVKG